MRITINRVVFSHLCHFALDHWEGKTLLIYVILSNSLWFSVIHKELWKFSGVIPGVFSVYCWFANHSEIIFGMILGDSQWFIKNSDNFWPDSWWLSVICKPLWNYFLGDSQWFVKNLRIFLVILSDSQTTLKFFWGDSWWFSKHPEIFWGNSQWFTNHSENFLRWFLLPL